LIGYSRGLFIRLGHQSKFLRALSHGSRLDFVVVSNGIIEDKPVVERISPGSFIFFALMVSTLRNA
jgi:hypothetical protein